MWTPQEIATARANLSGYAVYQPLLDETTKPLWGAKELAAFLSTSGIRPRTSRDQVIDWCSAKTHEGQRAFPGAIDYGGSLGWRIPNEDVICFFGHGIVSQLESTAKQNQGSQGR
jgi:hypothetical protein